MSFIPDAGALRITLPESAKSLYGALTRWIYSPAAYALMMRIV